MRRGLPWISGRYGRAAPLNGTCVFLSTVGASPPITCAYIMVLLRVSFIFLDRPQVHGELGRRPQWHQKHWLISSCVLSALCLGLGGHLTMRERTRTSGVLCQWHGELGGLLPLTQPGVHPPPDSLQQRITCRKIPYLPPRRQALCEGGPCQGRGRGRIQAAPTQHHPPLLVPQRPLPQCL